MSSLVIQTIAIMFFALSRQTYLTVITVIGRLLSGVHWFTDIIAGIIISGALLMTFYSIINATSKNNIIHK